jgi:hypothetical protein
LKSTRKANLIAAALICAVGTVGLASQVRAADTCFDKLFKIVTV